MKSLHIKLILSIFGGIFLEQIFFNVNKTNANYLVEKKRPLKTIELTYKNKKVNTVDNIAVDLIKKNLISDLSSDKLIVSLLSEKEKNSEGNIVDIESTYQSVEGDNFIAEGNVIFSIFNSEFKADKIIYNRKTKIFKAFGNLRFQKGEQYFEADNLKYDLKNKNGSVENIYGVLNALTLKEELNIGNLESKNKIVDNVDILSIPSELELLNTNNLEFKNKSEDTLKLITPQLSKWRFKSNKINIIGNTFNAPLIYFTNDPFNKPQFLLESKNFFGEIVNNDQLFIKSNSTFIKLDDFFKIPIGQRTFENKNSPYKWGLGYSLDKKGGIYSFKNHDSIDISKFTLDLQSQYLIQRFVRGKTDLFRAKDSSLASDRIVQNTKPLDNFGLKSKLTGELFDFDIKLNTDLHSLNLDKLDEATKSELTIQKRINTSNTKEGIYKTDLGFYGLYGLDTIQNALGIKIVNNLYKKSNSFEKNYNLILDYGNYFAKSIGKDSYLNLDRFGILASFSNSYKILDLNSNIDYSPKNIYTPKKTDQGVYFDTSISGMFYEYSNGKAQGIGSLAYGPNLVYGEFQDRFFDYTSLSIKHQIINKKGSSPLLFDDFVNESRILINLEQQIFGPITAKFEAKLKIDNGSFFDKKYSLNVNRRAYSLGLYVDEKDDSFGLAFKVYNFGYKGNSTKF